jgi:hypothetical protein
MPVCKMYTVTTATVDQTLYACVQKICGHYGNSRPNFICLCVKMYTVTTATVDQTLYACV